MSFRINSPLDHIERALGIQKEPGSEHTTPSFVLDTIQATVEAKGWQVLKEFDSFNVTVAGTGANTDAASPAVPEGEAHYVFACSASHDHGVTKDIVLQIFSRRSVTAVALIPTVANVGANFFIAIPRPVLLHSGQILNYFQRQVAPIGSNMFITGHFVRLAVGEYVPGSPYG